MEDKFRWQVDSSELHERKWVQDTVTGVWAELPIKAHSGPSEPAPEGWQPSPGLEGIWKPFAEANGVIFWTRLLERV
jgi:hypothetical protein